MKIKLLSLLIILISIKSLAQSGYILGNVSNENGDKLPNTSIFNLRTEQEVQTDQMGNFAIAAKPSDELRVVRRGYERQSVTLAADSFSKSLEVKLLTIPQDIEEVKIAFHPTGILKKDVASLNPSRKVVELNSAMNNYMKTKPTEVFPKSTVPSSFKQPDLSAGQLNLVKLAGAIGGLIKKASDSPKTTANYAETEAFYNRVKAVVDKDYFAKYGIVDYDFDIFLAYADNKYQLSKNYRNNFNKVAIENYLKEALVEYLKTHKTSVAS